MRLKTKSHNISEIPSISFKMIRAAFFLDLTFIFLINQIFVVSYLNFLKISYFFLPQNMMEKINSQTFNIHLISFILLFFGHFFISYYMSNGKTLGKALYGLKVIHTHSPEKMLSLNQCLIRSLAHLLNMSFIFIPGLLIYLLSTSKIGPVELLSKTSIVSQDDFDLFLLQKKESKNSNIYYLPLPEKYRA